MIGQAFAAGFCFGALYIVLLALALGLVTLVIALGDVAPEPEGE